LKKYVNILIIIVVICPFLVHSEKKKIELSLKDAVFYALKNNLNLQVQRIDPTISQQSLRGIKAATFIPKLTVDLSGRKTKSPASGFLDGAADVNINESFDLSINLQQKFMVGGTLEVQLTNSQYETNSYFYDVNPRLSSELRFTLSQPLLKNFGSLATKKDIIIAYNDNRKAQAKLKSDMMDLINNVENAYWGLVQAYQNYDASKEALERSKDFLRQGQLEVKIGTKGAEILFQQKASVASNENQLIQSERNIFLAEKMLKDLLNMTKSKESIVPSDEPEVEQITTDLNEFLLEALKKRPDIEMNRLDLKSQNVQVKYYRNQMLPDLSITASYWTTGLGGDKLVREGGDIFGQGSRIVDIIQKDIWNTMQDVFTNMYKNYSFGLRLQVPLSLSKEKSDLVRARLNLKKILLQLQGTENLIFSEVEDIIDDIQAQEKLVDGNKLAYKLREETLNTELKLYSLGLSSSDQIIRYQDQLSLAQRSTIQAIVDYNKAISRKNKILGTSLEKYNIKINSKEED
jgi:outer membrane protein TolC